MFNFDKFRPTLTERAMLVCLAIQNDAEMARTIRWAEKNRTFTYGNIRINNYRTAIDSAIDEMSERLGIRLSTMEKLDIATNFICDFGNKNQGR
ncbi:MAG: hypothetical protein IJ899_03145 [Blautia sp.]|nr:hypothetical protein [Blautia sp.]